MKRTWKLFAAMVMLGLLAAPLAFASEEKTHEVTATVVSVNVQDKTITFKDGEGNEKTAPVLAPAVAALEKTKAGEKVVLTCKDMDGKHTGVTAIAPAKA